jgi:hypothetical protein
MERRRDNDRMHEEKILIIEVTSIQRRDTSSFEFFPFFILKHRQWKKRQQDRKSYFLP